MEFEKLQAIIADVLNVPKDDITPETTFVDDLGNGVFWCKTRRYYHLRRFHSGA